MTLPGEFSVADRIRGVFFGAALGDACGYQASPDAPLVISGHTQLGLYVADGLLEVLEWASQGTSADPAASVWLALLRWHKAQFGAFPEDTPQAPGRWIDDYALLGERREPLSEDVVTGLQATEMRLVERVANPDARGPEALTRSWPYGVLTFIDEELRASLVRQGAVLTHGHEDAWQPAVAFAQRLAALVAGDSSPTTPVQGSAETDAGAPFAPAVYARAVTLSEADTWDELFERITMDPTPAATGAVAGALWGARHGYHQLAAQAEPCLGALAEHDIVQDAATRWIALAVDESVETNG